MNSIEAIVLPILFLLWVSGTIVAAGIRITEYNDSLSDVITYIIIWPILLLIKIIKRSYFLIKYELKG